MYNDTVRDARARVRTNGNWLPPQDPDWDFGRHHELGMSRRSVSRERDEKRAEERFRKRREASVVALDGGTDDRMADVVTVVPSNGLQGEQRNKAGSHFRRWVQERLQLAVPDVQFHRVTRNTDTADDRDVNVVPRLLKCTAG